MARDAENKQKQKLFRRQTHEFEAALIRRPLALQDAYGQFGLLLGIVPPAAIFGRIIFDLARSGSNSAVWFFVAIFVLMNIVCAFVGRAMGRSLAHSAAKLERASWSAMLMTVPFVGLLWGMVTGFVGGLIFFGFGALAGFLIAAPIGAIAFALFAVFHRLFERGTIIDQRHFLPVACGISLTIAAFILGL